MTEIKTQNLYLFNCSYEVRSIKINVLPSWIVCKQC